jgi:sugar phosphate isomerase/epimerase
MNKNPAVDRLAVCSWSLQPANPEDLVAKLAACGVRRVQLALDPLRESPEVWSRTETLFRQNNIAIVSGMFGCVGEDYSTLESIRKTGGIAPDATWEQNRGNIKDTAALAGRMGLKLVTFHAGFIPHKETDPDYAKLLNRLEEASGIFAAANIALALETGQETASSLAALLKKLRRPNLGVNFDPANMILYNQGDPIEAVRALAPWIRQVHIKDATRTKVPGTWGEEVAAGTGEVDWPIFFATLRQLNFNGDFVIEREAGTRRAPDIITARAVVEKNIA